MREKKVIWQIKDGKRGHENQSAGLVRALSKLLPIESIPIELAQEKASWFDYLLGSRHLFDGLVNPDLIVGAGSGTHATVLTAGRMTKAPTIMLMTPPTGIRRLFDLCIAPEHDGTKGPNFITTRGVLNLIENTNTKAPDKGLLLIGGPSKHHSWDKEEVIQQITEITESCPNVNWTATTSRRTPATCESELNAIQASNMQLVPVEQTDADWLPRQLSHANYVWVTEDSVSMIYEALSSGAKVGLLPVPRKEKASRVLRGVDHLIAEKQAMPYTQAHCDLSTFPAPPPLNEAERIAKIVVERFSWS